MVVQVPSPPSRTPDAEIDAGVIEDARRRQRRHRRIGSALLAVVAAGSLLAGMAAGGRGNGGGGSHPGARPAGSGPGAGSAHATPGAAFPGAPVTQPNGYGVESDVCPLAPRNRYLPARAGCVTVRRADINGDGRRDLVIVYSTLGRRHPAEFNGEPSQLLRDFFATRAYLKVVFAGGGSVTVAVAQPRLTHAAALDAIAHVSDQPGSEIFLEIMRISSGGTVAAYGFHAGQLVPAGVPLSFGGDAAAAASFDCLPGHPPRLVQRSYLLIGPTIYGWWRVHQVTYAWRQAKLARVGERTFKRRGGLTRTDYAIGRGCLRGVR